MINSIGLDNSLFKAKKKRHLIVIMYRGGTAQRYLIHVHVEYNRERGV